VIQVLLDAALFGTPVLQKLIHNWHRAAVQGSVRQRKLRNMNRLMGPLAFAVYIGYERSVPRMNIRLDLIFMLPLLLVIPALWLDYLIKYQDDFPDPGGG
jgi:hypothetical protein